MKNTNIMIKITLHHVLLFSICLVKLIIAQNLYFPNDFLFGVATASYQIEGGWNESDKGENIWDVLTHEKPNLILDNSNGDVACDSFHRIGEDVALIKELGVDFYRFSISWSRLLPSAFSNKVSETGLKYYNDLINSLLNVGVKPMITLYHWDLPNVLQKLGGWTNPTMVEYFEDYARVVFENFGDRVKYWITFNEPSAFCAGYASDNYAPFNVKQPGIADYLCVHTVLKSHARVYHLYQETFKPYQNGLMGITYQLMWYEANSTSTVDVLAQQKILQFAAGLYAHPIFSKLGDYPEIVKKSVAERSSLEGFPYSRLPEFTREEIDYIRGTADFYGLNHYSTFMVGHRDEYGIGEPNMMKDEGVEVWNNDPRWDNGSSWWLKTVPWGFKKVLTWIQDEYNYPIYVTENGFSDSGEIEDDKRVKYYQTYLLSLLESLNSGINVKAYTAWSLLDNFEWNDGYKNRFGLHYVNMSDPNRRRIPKKSAKFYKKIIKRKFLAKGLEKSSSLKYECSKFCFYYTLFFVFLIL